jgi:pseudo-rSAM protein
MGDLIDTSHRSNKPIQFKPIPSLQKTFGYMTTTGDKSEIMVNDELKDYLSLITLYINDRCRQSCSVCNNAYKQFLYCFKGNTGNNKINISDISKLFKEIKNSKLYKINIVGGNIFNHPELIAIVKMLNNAKLLKEYIIHYLNMEDNKEYFSSLTEGNNQLRTLIHFPLKMDVFNHQMDILGKYYLNKKFTFVIKENEDIVKVEQVISEFKLDDYELLPYYNGNNKSFFKENVFIDREAIIESKPTMHDIFTRMTLNTSDFKKLVILSNKEVYANLNHPKIGRYGKSDIFDLIYKELHRGKSWTRVRNNVNPCKSCVYNALCPPISDYEYAIGRYNLCNIM